MILNYRIGKLNALYKKHKRSVLDRIKSLLSAKVDKLGHVSEAVKSAYMWYCKAER